MKKSKQSATTSIYPIGAVISYAGPPLDAQAWLLCDGKAYPKGQYEQLYTRIGDTYGAEGDNFNVPDYRGMFLRGDTKDIAVGQREEDATAKPHNPFLANFNGIPNKTMNAGAGTGDNAAKSVGAQTINTCTTGGDGDTRPTNVYVQRYIRAL